MTILTIGKRFVPTEQIAYVESFDPSTANRTSNLRKTSSSHRTKIVTAIAAVALVQQSCRQIPISV
jgi:hypothetical protein